MDSRFKNAILDAIVVTACTPGDKMRHVYPDAGLISIMYDGTMKGSSAQRLMVCLFVEASRVEESLSQQNYPHDFLMDVIRDLGQPGERRPGLTLESCELARYGFYEDEQ